MIDGCVPLVQNQLGFDLAVFRETGILYVKSHSFCNRSSVDVARVIRFVWIEAVKNLLCNALKIPL